MATPAIGTPTLIGVGVGPGDPELVTLKAVAVFEAADVILGPATEASGREAGRAEQLVLAVCPTAATKLQRVPFSMAQRSGIGTKRRQSWMASAKAAEQAFADGATTVAFATVGDPSVYSTFSYLAAHVREAVGGLTVSVVPGITAMQALAAVSLTPLVEGTESLTLGNANTKLIPGTNTLAIHALNYGESTFAINSGTNTTVTVNNRDNFYFKGDLKITVAPAVTLVANNTSWRYQTPSLPVPRPANDATREKQIPFRPEGWQAGFAVVQMLNPKHQEAPRLEMAPQRTHRGLTRTS